MLVHGCQEHRSRHPQPAIHANYNTAPTDIVGGAWVYAGLATDYTREVETFLRAG